jgi:hypothetical protein
MDSRAPPSQCVWRQSTVTSARLRGRRQRWRQLLAAGRANGRKLPQQRRKPRTAGASPLLSLPRSNVPPQPRAFKARGGVRSGGGDVLLAEGTGPADDLDDEHAGGDICEPLRVAFAVDEWLAAGGAGAPRGRDPIPVDQLALHVSGVKRGTARSDSAPICIGSRAARLEHSLGARLRARESGCLRHSAESRVSQIEMRAPR